MIEPQVAIAIATTGDRETIFKTISSIYEQNYQNIVLKIVTKEPELKKIKEKIALNFGNAKSTDFIVEKEKGFSAALNQAFSNSRSCKYFGWINDDDFLAAGAVERAVFKLEQTQAIAIFGQLAYLNNEGKRVGLNKSGKLGFFSSKYGPNLTPQPGSFFRVDAVKDSQLLVPEYKYAMDLDLWLRLAKNGKFEFLPEVQAFMLWHKDATTVRDRKKALLEAYQIRKNHSNNKIQKFIVKLFWIPTKIIAYLSLKFI